MKRMCTVRQLIGVRSIALAISAALLPSFFGASAFSATNDSVWQLANARDRQDLGSLDKSIEELRTAAEHSSSAEGQYRAALAYSYAAEVAMELRQKKKSASYAESGIDFARKAVSANSGSAEYHRLLGQVCGQIIPADPIFGALKYGQCARDEINKAIELDPHLALAYVSRGVGNYYLPPSMGGGPELAIKDFDKASQLDPKLSDAYLWKGLALNKENKHSDARQVLQHALQLDPNRLWIKQELDKTPAS